MTVIPNDSSPEVSARNRATLELGGHVLLPRGTVHVDRAPRLPSGTTLEGSGPACVLSQSHIGTPYPANCTVWLQDTAVGSYDAISSRDGPSVALAIGTDMSGYQVGRVVWSWRWQSYTGECERHVIREVFPEDWVIFLDRPVPDDFDALKWSNGLPIEDAPAGADEVRVISRGPLKLNPPFWCQVAGGPCVVDECSGEFRRVVAIEDRRILLDRPLTRAWGKAAIILGPWIEDVTIRGLTLAIPPVNAGALPFFSRGCVNLRLEAVTTPAGAAPVGFSTSGYGRVLDCDFGGSVGIGTCHDLDMTGMRIGGGVDIEEGSHDMRFRGGLSYGTSRGKRHGFQMHTGTNRVSIADWRLEGFGHHGTWALTGCEHGLSVRNVEVRLSNPATELYVGAVAGGTLERVASDVPLVITGGTGWRLERCRAAKFELREGTTGILAGCAGPVVGGEGWETDAAENVDSDDED